MTLLSTMASTHQAHYKLKVEKYQHAESLKGLEDELWSLFLSSTQFRGLIVDVETAFSSFVKNSIGSMPGLEVVLDAKLRPDLSGSKFTQPGLSGKILITYDLDSICDNYFIQCLVGVTVPLNTCQAVISPLPWQMLRCLLCFRRLYLNHLELFWINNFRLSM